MEDEKQWKEGLPTWEEALKVVAYQQHSPEYPSFFLKPPEAIKRRELVRYVKASGRWPWKANRSLTIGAIETSIPQAYTPHLVAAGAAGLLTVMPLGGGNSTASLLAGLLMAPFIFLALTLGFYYFITHTVAQKAWQKLEQEKSRELINAQNFLLLWPEAYALVKQGSCHEPFEDAHQQARDQYLLLRYSIEHRRGELDRELSEPQQLNLF